LLPDDRSVRGDIGRVDRAALIRLLLTKVRFQPRRDP
jgi:hypothetical protein